MESEHDASTLPAMFFQTRSMSQQAQTQAQMLCFCYPYFIHSVVHSSTPFLLIHWFLTSGPHRQLFFCSILIEYMCVYMISETSIIHSSLPSFSFSSIPDNICFLSYVQYILRQQVLVVGLQHLMHYCCIPLLSISLDTWIFYFRVTLEMSHKHSLTQMFQIQILRLPVSRKTQTHVV